MKKQSKQVMPKFFPGDHVMFTETSNEETDEVLDKLTELLGKMGDERLKERVKQVQKRGITCYTTVVFVCHDSTDEQPMYGLWGPNGIVRRSEEDLTAITK